MTDKTKVASSEEITTLLTHSAYNPAIVPQLESYVRSSVTSLSSTSSSSESTPYHFDANRTLVKLYQFFPHLAGDGGVVSLVLFLALLEFPSMDYVALTCLVGEKVRGREPCLTLARCAELLESCQFSEFWPTFRQLLLLSTDKAGSPSSEYDILKQAVSSPAAVLKLRKSIASILALSYRTAPLKIVLGALDLDNVDALKNLVQSEDYFKGVIESVDSSSVLFVASGDNTKRSRVFKEGVHFDAIASLISSSAAVHVE
mmetsp:Transcript_26388/g.38239  ORF Transcript_26388/g.38239 Transcript_26388/m.38239 type:complete len:259 (+) Transcript_26388:147-923(+)